MGEFLLFTRHLLRLLHFVRGVLLTMLLGLLVCVVLLVLVEDESIGAALYFTLITGLTVGYGDIVPTTGFGRLISVVIALIGVLFVGILVAIGTRALAHAVEEHRGQRR
jgi:voltage-gated potassium channel